MAGDEGEEGRRQAYLAALGIPLWSSRHSLPGAGEAAPLEFRAWVAEGNAPVTEPVPAAPVTAAPSRPVETVPPVSSATAPVRATRPAEPAPRPSVPDAAAGDFPRFVCRMQALAPGWSTVVTLGDAPDLSALEHRLLGGIADALGGDALSLPPCEQLRWPLNRNPALDHSAHAMVEWLAHALKLPQGRCIVFGEAMAAHVRAAFPDHAIITAPALSRLLEEPLRKRELWQSLHG